MLVVVVVVGGRTCGPHIRLDHAGPNPAHKGALNEFTIIHLVICE